jgi:hypothetical protein
MHIEVTVPELQQINTDRKEKNHEPHKVAINKPEQVLQPIHITA